MPRFVPDVYVTGVGYVVVRLAPTDPWVVNDATNPTGVFARFRDARRRKAELEAGGWGACRVVRMRWEVTTDVGGRDL